MPRGPFPFAAFFGEGDGSASTNRDCCGGCGSREGHSANAQPNNGPTGPPPVAAPIANFLPVPTRPVFTPWMSDVPDAPEVTGPLAWRQAITPATSERADNSQSGEERSPAPLVQRARSPLKSVGEPQPLEPPVDWHAASAK